MERDPLSPPRMVRPLRRYFRTARRAVYSLIGLDLPGRRRLALPVSWLGSEYGAFGVWTGPLGPDSVVYSAGVGEDVSFDLALIDACGLRVDAFDPTPYSVEWVGKQTLPDAFRFEAVGVAAHDGEARFFLPAQPEIEISAAIGGHGTTCDESTVLPVRRIETLMAERGHRHIDVLKLDIEGAEYDVLDDMLDSDLDVGQILVEVHHFLGSFSERRALVRRTKRLRRRMRDAGYRLFAVSDLGHDYSFVRVGADGRPRVHLHARPGDVTGDPTGDGQAVPAPTLSIPAA